MVFRRKHHCLRLIAVDYESPSTKVRVFFPHILCNGIKNVDIQLNIPGKIPEPAFGITCNLIEVVFYQPFKAMLSHPFELWKAFQYIFNDSKLERKRASISPTLQKTPKNWCHGFSNLSPTQDTQLDRGQLPSSHTKYSQSVQATGDR